MTVVWDASALDSTDDGGSDAQVTFRVNLTAANLGTATGNVAQVSFRTGTSNSAAGSPLLSGAWIGQAASAGSINFSGNQVQLKFSGSATLTTTSAASVTYTSDTVTLGENWDNTKDYVVSFRLSTGLSANCHLIVGTKTGANSQFLVTSAAGEEALTTASGGYTAQAGTDQFLRQIIITAAGDTLGGAMPILMMSRRRRDPVKTLLLPSKYRRWARGFALAA